MSEYLEEGFEDWLRDLPIEFINHMYSLWQTNMLLENEDDMLCSLGGSDLTYVGPLNTDKPLSEAISFIIRPAERHPEKRQSRPISRNDIQKLNSILRDNGIEESA